MGQHLERATPDPVERQAARDGGGDGGTRRPECRPATVGTASGAVRSDLAEHAPEFPGCRPVRITRAAIDDHEGRFEYWDAATETAWVVREPTSVYHEGPGQQLAGLLTRIAAVRGVAHPDPRHRRPVAVRREGRAAAHHAGRPGGLARPGGVAAAGRQHRGGGGPPARRGARGSTTRPTFAAASWACTSRGASPRCGSRCRRAARPAAGRG